MKKLLVTAVSLGAGLAAIVGISAVAGHSAPAPEPGPPASHDQSVPSMPRDLGTGEQLLLVVGGQYSSQAEADAANAGFDFGEIQGFYSVPVDQFQGLRSQLNGDGDWVLASAFRTKSAADQFLTVAKIAGDQSALLTSSRVTSVGAVFAGLGQEAAPDGQGPLTHQIPASKPNRP